ncbi:MAG: hypothetical protein RLZZ361_970 [Cyanobacteriota bacterium]|jgi:hypothetical protein
MTLIKNFFIAILILVASGAFTSRAFAEKTIISPDDMENTRVQTLPNKPLDKDEFYELVHDNLRPDTDEFYVSSIFTIKGKPRALIKKSINKRAGDLYVNNSEYGIGDYLAKGFKIKDISFSKKEVLVLEESSGDLYGLTVTYGDAKSRLIKKTLK